MSRDSKQAMPLPTHPRESYTVGIICALDVEKAAVEATLDEEHGGVGKMTGDDNSYSFGRIGQHAGGLPSGRHDGQDISGDGSEEYAVSQSRRDSWWVSAAGCGATKLMCDWET
ncbi:hypothetical protein LTR49_026228 [Elasticomyces elasticus]|nr:hypothetical protein LTR49_026228 [Elasticomyces elasticus]